MLGRGGIGLIRRRWGLLALVLCLLIAGVAYAGWRVNRATDPALVDPIVMPADLELRSGDIVLAGGVSLQSRAVRAMAGGQTYSHVGLLEATDRGVFVIHASPKGAGDGGLGECVARLPLSAFLSDRGYVTLRVLRLSADTPNAGTIAQGACALAGQYADDAVPFDSAFDTAGHERLYCSELVWLCYQRAGLQWPGPMTTDVSTPLVSGPVLLPGCFANSPHFDTVWNNNPTPKGNR